MNHKLRILVRLDLDHRSAVLAVNGCLTIENYRVLLPVIRRASALMDGLAVTVDFSDALHVDAGAAAAIAECVALEYQHHDVGVVVLRFPAVYPPCALLARAPAAQHLIAS